MNKKNTKTRLGITILLIMLFAFIGFSHKAKAEASISVYHLITSDTTPVIRGTVGEAGASVSIVIIGYVSETVTALDNGNWSYQLKAGEALPTEDYYAVGVATIIGGNLVDDSAWIYIEDEYPLDIYYNEEETSLIIFPNEYTYTSEDDQFSIMFAAGTEITREGGETFGDEWTWYIEGVQPNNERIILKLRFGIPDINLSFSKDVTITFDVGEEYNGQILHIFSRSDGGDDGWEPMDIDCTVENGSCSFVTDHASYFAITEYNSIAETEEGENDDEDDDNDDSEKADIDSWKTYQYRNNNSVSCPDKLVLEIKGKHFDKDAKVKIGNIKAYSVDKKSSKKITAKFCMDDLLKVKTGKKRTVSVTNPDTDKEKADKKINLADIGYDMSVDDFDSQTVEGVKNIQTALVQLGLLDSQYITGIYGPITTEAVRKFQADNGIPQTGFVVPLTKAKLQEKIK